MKKILFSITLLAAVLFSANVNAQIVIDDFEAGIGNFWDPNGSGSTVGVDEACSFTADNTGGANSTANSAVLTMIDDVNSTDNWLVREYKSSATPVFTTADGKISVWLKTDASPDNSTFEIILDENNDAGHTMERTIPVPVIADGAYHLYEFDLSNSALWEGWPDAIPGDGILTGDLNLDALGFRAPDGSANWVVNIDEIIVSSGVSTAINDELSLNSAKMFPTVVSNEVTLELNLNEAKNVSVEIFDYQGRRVYSQNMNVTAGGTRYQIDMSEFAASMYIAKVKGDNFNKSIKIIKK